MLTKFPLKIYYPTLSPLYDLVIIEQKYSLEILTTRIIVEDNNYFSCIKLFDKQVNYIHIILLTIKIDTMLITKIWIFILLSTIGISLLVHSMLKFKKNLFKCFFEIVQILLTQSNSNNGHLIDNKKHKCSHKNTLDLILIMWISMSCILYYWFTSELLTIYSTKQNIPLVQSLEDICNKKELLVAGMTSLNDLSIYDEELAKNT